MPWATITNVSCPVGQMYPTWTKTLFPYLPLTIVGSQSIAIQIKNCQTGRINSESNLGKQREISMNVSCRLIWPIILPCILLVIHLTHIYLESPHKKQPLQPWFHVPVPAIWLTFSMFFMYTMIALQFLPPHATHQPSLLTHRVTKEMLTKQNKHPSACQLVLCKLALLQCPAIF